MTLPLSQFEILLTLAILVLATILLSSIPRRAQKLPLPPSPKSDPIIGHLRYLPTSEQDNVYTRWSQELKSEPPTDINLRRHYAKVHALI
jgi:hypothetical protein